MAITKLNVQGVSDAIATDLAQAGRKNLIINGAMQVAQRGTSATGVTSIGYHSVDRWETAINSYGTWTVSQDSDAPDGFSNSSKVLCTIPETSPATTSYITFRQRIEAQNLQHLKWGTSSASKVTVSFWVKSNVTGTYTLAVENEDGPNNNGRTYTINSANTWEYKTLTYDGDTAYAFDNDNNPGIELQFWLYAGSNFTSGTFTDGEWTTTTADRVPSSQVTLGDATNEYWQITGVQLEVGDTATDFEHRSHGEELALCQRYFIRYSNETGTTTSLAFPTFAWSGGSAYGNVFFPATMRAIPTFVQSGTNIFRVYINGGSYVQTGSSLGVAGTSCAEIYTYGTSASGFTRFEGTTAWCHFDAEL